MHKGQWKETHKSCFGSMHREENKENCFVCLEKVECFQLSQRPKHHLAINCKTRKIVIKVEC